MSDTENVELDEGSGQIGDAEMELGDLADRRRSSRRRESSRQQQRKSGLEKLREARQSGKGYRPNVEIQNVYDVVDEDEYNKIVAQRQQSDFVVDDDGAGYVDHGVDFEEEYGNDDHDDEEGAGRSKKGSKERKKEKKEGKKTGIDKFFTPFANTKPKTVDDAVAKLDEDEDLKNMLAELGDDGLDFDYDNIRPAAPHANRNPFKRSAVEDNSVIMPRPLKAAKLQKTSKNEPKVTFQDPFDDVAVPEPDIPPLKHETYSQMDDATGIYEDSWDRAPSPPPKKVEEPKPSRPISELRSSQDTEVKVKSTVSDDEFDENPTIIAKQPTTFPENLTWDTEDEKKEVQVEVVAGSEAFYMTRPDGQKFIRVYWLDAFENQHKTDGTVYLFGKVCTSGSNYSSCCLVVKNIQRQVFFLPRKTKLVNGMDSGFEVTDADVVDEVKRMLKRHCNVTEYKIKPTMKRLTLDCAPSDMPLNESVRVLEVHYSSSSARLPLDLTGSTFSAVFNLTTTPLERLLTEVEIKGPGWLDATNYEAVGSHQTYCDFEFTVDMERMKNVTYQNELNVAPPTVRMLAINVVTTLNEKKENEICMISTLFNSKCNLSNPTAEQKQLQRLTLITKPTGGALPFDLKAHLTKNSWSELVLSAGNEKALLSLFLAKLAKYDPDLLIGHDLSVAIHLLANRMEKLKVVEWSRTSRLRRFVNLNKIGHTKAAQWELTAGRMQLDSKVSAMELVRLRSYDLTELTGQLLNVNRQNVYANEVLTKFSNSRDLMSLINWSWTESWLVLRIVAQLNALPLYVQITNIVGGVMSRTLMGGRAERNEFLLLHAFHKANVIAPNKQQSAFRKEKGNDKKTKKTAASEQQQTLQEDDFDKEGEEDVKGAGQGKTAAASNKAQYSGGLVLDPKIGLYETMILLLDFNSLYPSIIQEYNICFTTIHYSKDSDEVPPVPDGGLPEGVLPKEIRQLVERRREVKKLLKTEHNDVKRKQYDIRQMALKLTANSMYGCLGFQQSRFYAKPLAALVTFKGREILMHSKTLVEKIGYEVIYGDTDSIMINTQSTDLAQVKKLGQEIKTAVNKCHRLLELELDGVFKRMLLLKKKKYAALTVDLEDEGKTKKELKGLDIVRRDWSQIARETGNEVVNLLLSTNVERFDLYEAIENTLKNIKEKIDKNELPLEVYQISKQLTRDPKSYADVKSQPHAAVALRLNASGKFSLRHGDIVEYIICEDGTGNGAMQRAYHRTEMENNDNLKIDVNYYLSHQIHPVVSRLCAPIEEMDAVRIAVALGLDGTNYRRAAAASSTKENEDADFDMHHYRFKNDFANCEDLSFDCPNPTCIARISVRSTLITSETEPARLSLEECPHCFTLLANHSNFVINHFTNLLSSLIEKHLMSDFKCDDDTCNFHTRVHTLKWFAEGLECPKCLSGVLRKEYTTKNLYDQQAFFREILDLDAALLNLKQEERRMIQSKVTFQAVESLYSSLLGEVNRFMERNDYNIVDLSLLFSIFHKPANIPRHLQVYYNY